MLMNKRPTTGDHQMAVGCLGTPSPTGVNNIAVRAVIITPSTANIETLKKKFFLYIWSTRWESDWQNAYKIKFYNLSFFEETLVVQKVYPSAQLKSNVDDHSIKTNSSYTSESMLIGNQHGYSIQVCLQLPGRTLALPKVYLNDLHTSHISIVMMIWSSSWWRSPMITSENFWVKIFLAKICFG